MNENNDKKTTAVPAPRLTWPDVVRKRPGMYWGGIDNAALHQLAWTIIDHAVDDTLNNGGHHIAITLQGANVVSVSDSGAGIPVEFAPDTDRSFLELLLTDMQRRMGQASHRACRVSWYDAGLACTNAGSAEFTVQVKRNGFLWQQQYREGIRQSELEQVRPLLSNEPSGTTITFRPDFTIFAKGDFDYQRFAQRCRELAYLMPELTLKLSDQRSGHEQKSDTFYFPDGLKAFVSYLNRGYTVLHDPIVTRETVALKRKFTPLGYSADIAIALQYTQVHQPVVLGFVNTVDVEGGGTHLRGLIGALTRALSDDSPVNSGRANAFSEDDIVCGLTAVLHIWHPSPKFVGATRYELANSELEDATYDVTYRALEAFSAIYPDQVQHIIEKCLQNKKLRLHRRYGT